MTVKEIIFIKRHDFTIKIFLTSYLIVSFIDSILKNSFFLKKKIVRKIKLYTSQTYSKTKNRPWHWYNSILLLLFYLKAFNHKSYIRLVTFHINKRSIRVRFNYLNIISSIFCLNKVYMYVHIIIDFYLIIDSRLILDF